ncbi:hypothetical protein FRC98_01805 [Lujinxingia vulgaris]|uniref:PSP1 C-terminal domain-containing protein n=1 Tax=Lujinxingia vulgaris TaxID=2600176 RepID=A0A5C6XCN6_9DELT|nr:regulatory iron-sulfur-containing complex subunit RicT [Lujinxingia vulgaris]TXD39161.1 hypothetical protein FRC98_01805 [Lujinxingia vulgaris]
MTTTLFKPAKKQARPFGGKKKLYNVVLVRFRISQTRHEADARELQLREGDHVIVDTERGPTLAEICGVVSRKVLPADSLPRVLRKATEADIAQADKHAGFEEQAYRFAIGRIRSRKLQMKLIRAQYMHDGSKLVFYFSADGRIDFRDLVKDLAHKFRTRIEMHQIGVRDGARMLGGIGPCGRELCCSTFLDNFEPVSIRMAKDQGLTLNPKKVSGMCGRLMCCLVYEQQLYRRMRTKLPRAGKMVRTELGEAKILEVDVINRRVMVSFADNNRKMLPVTEIELIDPNVIDRGVDGAQEDESARGGGRKRRGSSSRRRSKSSRSSRRSRGSKSSRSGSKSSRSGRNRRRNSQRSEQKPSEESAATASANASQSNESGKGNDSGRSKKRRSGRRRSGRSRSQRSKGSRSESPSREQRAQDGGNARANNASGKDASGKDATKAGGNPGAEKATGERSSSKRRSSRRRGRNKKGGDKPPRTEGATESPKPKGD